MVDSSTGGDLDIRMGTGDSRSVEPVLKELDYPQHRMFSNIIPVKRIIDIGPGIKPVRFFKPDLHICVEPSKVYAKILIEHGYDVLNTTADVALKVLEPVDSIFLLDVIEHMEKEKGLEVLELAKKSALKQVVVFTPNGFLEQTTDAWGHGEDQWQTHRSGWKVSDFPGWVVRSDRNSIFAIWSAS